MRCQLIYTLLLAVSSTFTVVLGSAIPVARELDVPISSQPPAGVGSPVHHVTDQTEVQHRPIRRRRRAHPWSSCMSQIITCISPSRRLIFVTWQTIWLRRFERYLYYGLLTIYFTDTSTFHSRLCYALRFTLPIAIDIHSLLFTPRVSIKIDMHAFDDNACPPCCGAHRREIVQASSEEMEANAVCRHLSVFSKFFLWRHTIYYQRSALSPGIRRSRPEEDWHSTWRGTYFVGMPVGLWRSSENNVTVSHVQLLPQGPGQVPDSQPQPILPIARLAPDDASALICSNSSHIERATSFNSSISSSETPNESRFSSEHFITSTKLSTSSQTGPRLPSNLWKYLRFSSIRTCKDEMRMWKNTQEMYVLLLFLKKVCLMLIRSCLSLYGPNHPVSTTRTVVF